MMISSSFFRQHKDEEAEKTILAHIFIKSFFISSPRRGRWVRGIATPELLVLLVTKEHNPLLTPKVHPSLDTKEHSLSFLQDFLPLLPIKNHIIPHFFPKTLYILYKNKTSTCAILQKFKKMYFFTQYHLQFFLI